MKKVLLGVLALCALLFWLAVLLPTNDNVMAVAKDDPEMLAARKKAIDTLPELMAALKQPSPGSAISVKVAVVQGEITEYMWLGDVQIEGETLRGTMKNDGLDVDVEFGDAWSGRTSSISDWMIVKDGVLRGGYSVRVLYARMSAEERASFHEAAGFRITD